MSKPNPWKMVLEITVAHHLGDRATYFDIPGVVSEIVDRLGFVDIEQIDPAVFEEILDHNRRSV